MREAPQGPQFRRLFGRPLSDGCVSLHLNNINSAKFVKRNESGGRLSGELQLYVVQTQGGADWLPAAPETVCLTRTCLVLGARILLTDSKVYQLNLSEVVRIKMNLEKWRAPDLAAPAPVFLLQPD